VGSVPAFSQTFTPGNLVVLVEEVPGTLPRAVMGTIRRLRSRFSVHADGDFERGVCQFAGASANRLGSEFPCCPVNTALRPRGRCNSPAPANAATFEAAYATGFTAYPYGAAPTGQLAQSGSLTGQSYSPVPCVVALVDASGNVNSSTAIYNIFNNNNLRRPSRLAM
jgi:hypothetical protein